MASTLPKEKRDVREACVVEAMRIISQDGLDSLSLRDVARRLNISHQAPYKHFPSRDHILAEVIGRAYSDFTRHLETAVHNQAIQFPDGNPEEALAAIGRAYLEYALQNPLQYRLMFGTPLPDFKEHPGLADKAGQAFSILKEAIRAIRKDDTEKDLTMAALFAWSTVHGVASITQSGSFVALGLREAQELSEAIQYVMGHICAVVGSKNP
jgi:AcrR family transcriptional regulator